LIELGKLLERIPKFQPKRLGYYELKKHKPWSRLLKIIRSKDTSQSTVVTG
jgi:hypothetical protein